jgi:hypothetical protein
MTIPIADGPFYSENITVTAQNPINATHIEVSLSGNGTLTLSNSTETIAVNSTGTALVNALFFCALNSSVTRERDILQDYDIFWLKGGV